MLIEGKFIKDQVRATGPTNADIMLVGEAPGENEVREGVPFVGQSGKELDRMLHDAGILRHDCFLTNVARVRPQGNNIKKFFLKHTPSSRVAGPILQAGIDDLHSEIAMVKPKVIIALGDTALWALTGETGIVKWRGSTLEATIAGHSCVVVPTYHPAAILRQWSWRFAAVIDLRRAKGVSETGLTIPEYSFSIRPSFEEAMDNLSSIPPGRASLDLETRNQHIACLGIGTSRLRAFCIPFMCVERDEGYWTREEETALIHKIREVFKRNDIRWILQNGLYDFQYISRYWGIIPPIYMDTMLAHHVCFAGLPKGLDFLSSIYCQYHRYWKDDGKTWEKGMGEDQLWEYNCLDCTNTYEASEQLDEHLDALGLRDQFLFQMRQFPAVLRMMLRGVRCNESLKGELILELEEARQVRQQWIDKAVGRPLNIRSPKQMIEFFYEELRFPVIRNFKTGRPTTNDEALNKLTKKRPILSPFIHRIQELRSIGVFLSTFAMMKLDRDGRIRCSYNIAGTETYRYNSSENAFGSGTNLQNIPAGGSLLPNIRKMFVPDPGYELADADLDRADAQVVAQEARDAILIQMFREGADIHLENAKTIFANERLTKDSKERSLAKAGVHATNYGASAHTLARSLGITVREAEHFQYKWFSAHPGIRTWHLEVENSINTTRQVVNRFGFRRYYFDRIEGVLPEALAWIPQSTVALVICHGLVRLTEQTEVDIQPLLQVHDSLVFQYPKHMRNPALRKAEECMLVEVPYDPPLTIPVGFKISDRSWGECEDYDVHNYKS